MENVLFKISFPAEFHAQTAVEARSSCIPRSRDRLDEIEKIVITTHESAIRIIDKKGPLNNPADRDHCLQYMTAIGLIKGNLTAADYEDDVAARSARRCAARTRCVRREQAVEPRLSRPRQALDRQRGPGVLQGRHQDRERRRRISDRPPPPPQGRHAAARSQVQDQSRAPLCRPSSARRSSICAGTRNGSKRRRSTNLSICLRSRTCPNKQWTGFTRYEETPRNNHLKLVNPVNPVYVDWVCPPSDF